MSEVALYRGDCLEILKTLEPGSVDAVVTDPPAGIGFMGKEWDSHKGGRNAWVAWLSSVMVEVLRVLKPGGHALVWALPRTSHWTAWALEEAGFEIRDRVAHVFGSGFPKSLDIGKAMDKMAGAEREVIRVESRSQVVGHEGWDRPWKHAQMEKQGGTVCEFPITAPSTPEAQQWDGWGTALKPAMEDWWLCRKPLSENTIAANVLKWGTGGINVDGCRVGTNGESLNGGATVGSHGAHEGWRRPWMENPETNAAAAERARGKVAHAEQDGRFPANFTHDGSEEVMALFPVTTSGVAVRRNGNKGLGIFPVRIAIDSEDVGYDDTGSAARFFYCAPQDEMCSLCNLPLCKACDTIHSESQERSSLWESIFALSAEKNGWTIQATNECIARMSAITNLNERLVQNVRSAGGLCDSCATRIAAALVGIKTSAFSEAELPVILDCIGSCNGSILTQNLASFAELWENIDTIPTTTNLMLLFGSVRDAIANYTRQAAKEKAAGDNGQGMATRFRYFSKASKADRDEGCEELEEREAHKMSGGICIAEGRTAAKGKAIAHNFHPTVKSTPLMRWLCRLITPPGGVVLDLFMGSGSTGKAAMLEGFGFIGIEADAQYFEIAERRIEQARAQMRMAI